MKDIYRKLPVYIQNLILTFFNNYKYFQKFGAIPVLKPLSKVIKKIDVNEFNNENLLERINSLILYATYNVPFYIDNKHHYKPIKSLKQLNEIPVLKKQTLKQHNLDFISKQKSFFNSYSFKTSGSTGTPIFGSIRNSDLRKRFTMFLISLKLEGIDYSKPLARFPGADIARKGKVYRHDQINNHLIFSIYHLSDKNIIDYYAALNDYKIQILEGYPSTIISLVRLLKANNLKLPFVRNVLTTAEKLLDCHREEIESFFNIKVFDFYGSSEGSAYMYSCSKGYYLNSNQIAYFECVDENYNPVEINKSGRMLVTSFSSTFTPLIRYDIGDYATVTSRCNNVIKVDEILGRQEEIFITPDGKAFGRFSLILKHLPNEIIESQLILIQKSNKVVLKYLSKRELSIIDFKQFEYEMNFLLDMNFFFDYKLISKFDKSKRGKLSAIIINEGNL